MPNRRPHSRKSSGPVDAPAATGRSRRRDADINRQLRSWTARRIASWALMLGGLLVALQHLVAHAGFRPLPFSMGLQDFTVGYPTAVILIIAGAILIDPRPKI